MFSHEKEQVDEVLRGNESAEAAIRYQGPVAL